MSNTSVSNTSVETVLREIKERVRVEETRRSNASGAAELASPHFDTPASDPLLRLRSNLQITDRTWSKLPPVTSFHRRGRSARLEVWVKRQVKRATDWFFFEQVNFNAAVNGALHSTTAVLEQTLTEQRVCLKQLSLEMSEQQIVLDRSRRALDSRIDELAAKLEELHALNSRMKQS
jgi:hypothetical protein